MNIEPLGERVLVELLEQETVTESGIYLPEGTKESQYRGIIRATGLKNKNQPLNIGDIVLFPKYSGAEIEVNRTKYFVVKTDDILARLNEKK